MKAIVFLAILGLAFSLNLRRNEKAAIGDGIKTVGDLASSDYGDATVNGIHALTHVIPHNTPIGKIASNVNHFVTKEKGTISNGINAVSSAVKGDYGDATVDGIHAISDAIPKNTAAGKIARGINKFVSQHHGVISNGINAVGDVATGNYVGAVGDGLKAVADAIPHNNPIGKALGDASKFLNQNSGTVGAIEQGINTVGDVLTGNYVGAGLSVARGVGDVISQVNKGNKSSSKKSTSHKTTAHSTTHKEAASKPVHHEEAASHPVHHEEAAHHETVHHETAHPVHHETVHHETARPVHHETVHHETVHREAARPAYHAVHHEAAHRGHRRG